MVLRNVSRDWYALAAYRACSSFSCYPLSGASKGKPVESAAGVSEFQPFEGWPY